MRHRAERRSSLYAIALVAGVSLLSCACENAAGSRPIHAFSYDSSAVTLAKPWTSESFQNDPRHFQFAVIGDRTGGADAQGVFERAMGQLNLLRPEFVVNVGDAIEGYSKDESELTTMWEEFDRMVDKLEMPFFRTVGNHDMSNEAMQRMWLDRYGATFYYFVYGDVLFVVLNSEENIREAPADIGDKIEVYNRLQVEDPQKARDMLEEFMKDESVIAALSKPVDFGQEQVEWVEKTLAANRDVRWTFLFLHEPAWENPSDSFLAIEELLADRDYTFLGGHLHYYGIDERHGRDYITMGPAGASFHHEGPGNVDHLLWVTMTHDGPEIAKITLEGIYDRKGRDLQLKELYERKGWESETGS